MAAAVAAVAPATVCACPQAPPPLPPEPPFVVAPPRADGLAPLETCDDGKPVPADCRVACEAMAKVGCPESNDAGRSCGCVCEAAEKNGSPLPTLCVANQSTIEGMRGCGIRCR
jgi:hypothetical protein